MAKVFLLTGLSGAGKTTLANALCEAIKEQKHCVILDGDEMRKGVCKDLGFSPADREENLRRCGEIARILLDQGVIVILAVIAPYQKLRDNLKNAVGSDSFYTIYIDCPLEVCIQRDPKKNYKKAYYGQLKNYTGLGDAYEVPTNPDLVISTHQEDQSTSIKKLVDFVKSRI